MCDKKNYKHASGCPQGRESSGPVSRIVMDFWAKHIEQISERMEALAIIDPINYEKLTTYLLLKYVDYVLTSFEEMKPGVKWDPISKTLMWDQAKAKSDIDNKIDPEFITMQNFCNNA